MTDRRSITSALKGLGNAPTPQPDQAFVDALGQRLRGTDRFEVVAEPTTNAPHGVRRPALILLTIAALVLAVVGIGAGHHAARRVTTPASPGGGLGDVPGAAEDPPSVAPPRPSGPTPTTQQRDEPGTPTTIAASGPADQTPNELTLTCHVAGPARVDCAWTATTGATFARYVLLRSGVGKGRVVATSTQRTVTTASDRSAPVGSLSYLVDALDDHGAVIAHSQPVAITCC
ncbi:MAG: hypothetical protein NVS3B21_26400 [Acidimicrobiales bacterium]